MVPSRAATTRSDRPLILLAAVVLFACKENANSKQSEASQKGGWYRAVLLQPDFEEVPFYLSLPADSNKGGAVVINGKHWLSAQHGWTGERVEVDFPMYRTKILAAVGERNDLIGSWEVDSHALGVTSVPFRATRVEQPDPELKLRSANSPPPEVDPSGVWRLKFEKTGKGKLVLEKEGATAFGGTVWYAGGETMYLSGNVIGNRLVMSSFDGASPYHMSVEISGNRLSGQWATAPDLAFREKIKGKRAKKDFEIKEQLKVSAPDGRLRLPELDHPRYAGFPVIVEMAGSWCSHCKNAAPVLLKIYERYQAQDLKILTINYELTEDKSYNLQRAMFFKSEYGIPWQLVTREGTLDDFQASMPPGLSGPEGLPVFPITLFLKRDHTVHQLHSGFVGPESGASYERLTEKFDTWAKEILK